MENKLALQALPLSEVMTMAQTFAESGLFTDAKQQAQAFVKIIAGQEIGIPPFAAISGIHIVQGKPTIGAGLIASCIKGSGKYDYKVIKLDETACSLDFYQGKEKLGNSTFTIADARKAQTKNIDKFPKNMLFARAISNGVKWFCPDVFSGPVYTPEEMQDISHEVIPSTPAFVPPAEIVVDAVIVDESTGEVLLPLIPVARYTKLKNSLNADGSDKAGIIAKARQVFSFTEEQESEINDIVNPVVAEVAA
jgi:hypothetical protein